MVKLAEAEFGKDHSRYALAVLQKANTLVVARADEPVMILDELDDAQEAECRALVKNGRSFSKILLRIQLLKGTVMQKVQGNHRQAL